MTCSPSQHQHQSTAENLGSSFLLQRYYHESRNIETMKRKERGSKRKEKQINVEERRKFMTKRRIQVRKEANKIQN